MACEVKSFANIPDLKKVQELLGFRQDENWLSAVYYSISPTCETMAFGHGCKLIILSTQWGDQCQLPSYTITWKGELQNENEIITSILCVPVYGSNVSSGADWTCIAVGLASGMVLFYGDCGTQIYSQRWHPENVQSLKAQSGRKLPEEIHVGYVSCICILQGMQLFTVLRGHRQNLQGSTKSTRKNITHFPDTVSCRKWLYQARSDGVINDAVIVGTQKISSFDHYLEQSLKSGFYAKCRSGPAQNSLVLGVGIKPYASFYYAKEGFVQADLGDVAKAVASKVISSLPGWIFRSSSTAAQNPAEQEQAIPTGEAMNCRFGICDLQRHAYNVWLAPGNKLAVIIDNLSRVILIDCDRCVALRIWKGYRDAQCAFIEVKEKTLKDDKKEKRKSQFLVIYAPRRSCLEIWALQHGPKVAAFNVSKNAQLSYNGHGLMGMTPNTKSKSIVNSCLFLDPSDDTLKEIHIPFHCALSADNSNTAKDVHLLRRIKICIRDENIETDSMTDISTLCENIQTDEIRLQVLQMLTKTKNLKPKLFRVAVHALKLKINIDCIVNKNHRLQTLLKNYEKLVELYISLTEKSKDTNPKLRFPVSALSDNDKRTIQRLLDLLKNQSNSPNPAKVTFRINENLGQFVEFLNIFDVEHEPLSLKDNKIELYGFIGGNLFSRFIENGFDLDNFVNNNNISNISSEDMLVLLLHYWLEMNLKYASCDEVIEDMARFSIIIQHISNLTKEREVVDYNSISPWWQNVRELLLESSSAIRSLMAGIVCKNVSKHKIEKQISLEDEQEVWEEVSQEAAQWSLLIGKLDDISVLGAILSCPVVSNCSTMPIIPYEKPDCSLKSILCGGKGIVSELVGKWLVSTGIDPFLLLEASPIKTECIDVEHMDDENEYELLDPVVKNLHSLREHFPFSLESGILLSQMVWEYMSYWSKNLSNFDFLRAGLNCLAAFKTDDLALKHGLCGLVWNAHLKIPLEATKKLIHKVGKLPKEKLCQQDIGISVGSVPDFLQHCLEFLNHFTSSLEHKNREIKYEEILQNDLIPLSFLALQQNHAMREILKLHVEMCRVLHLIAYFSLKLPKPITALFDGMSNATFFVEMNRELNYTLPATDILLKTHREEFLCQAVSASMDLIREDLERLYVLEHATYMKKIEELSEIWDLDKNVIRKHQVLEMYAHGWDTYAEELFVSINNDNSIGQQILEIAGRRLNIYAASSQLIFCQVASIGPQLLNYLDNLKSKKNGYQIDADSADEIDLDLLISLTAKALDCLSERESKYLHIAGQMFDACSLIKSLKLTS